MGVKIKTLTKKATKSRDCAICGRAKEMARFERYCGPVCRQAATDMDKYGAEFKVALGNKKC